MLPRFSKFLAEELSPGQKEIVDSWSHGSKAESISSHVIPKGQHRAVLSLDDPHDGVEEHVEAPKHISDHLEQHGYKIKNYKAGTVEDKHGREGKIGKALVATKAPKEFVDHVNGDPARTASKKVHSNLEVVVSRHPHDVAGMSTDRGWRSCMTMGEPKTTDRNDPNYGMLVGGGSASHHLQDDVKHGTHVAYLVQRGDHEIKNPIARIALKPHTSHDGSHTILRPEETTYGSPASSFEHTVNKWTTKHFPMDDKHPFYEKHADLYHDSSPVILVNHQKLAKDPTIIHKIEGAKLTDTVYDMLGGGRLKQGHLDALMNHPHSLPTATNLAIRFGGDKEHVAALNQGGKFDKLVAQHTKNPVLIDHIAKHSSNSDALKTVTEPTNYAYDPEHVMKASKDAATTVAKRVAGTASVAASKSQDWKDLASHLAIEHPHTHDILMGLHPTVDRHIAERSSNPETLSKLATHENEHVRRAALGNMHSPQNVRINALKTKGTPAHEVHAAVDSFQMHDLSNHVPHMTDDARELLSKHSMDNPTLRALHDHGDVGNIAHLVHRSMFLDSAVKHEHPVIRDLAKVKLHRHILDRPIPSHVVMHDPKNVGKTPNELMK